jgi:hypothetical protein
MRFGSKTSVITFLALSWPAFLYPQTQSVDGVWTRVTAAAPQTLDFQPLEGPSTRYSMFNLNRERIGTILRSAPREFTEQAEHESTEVTVPFPDGKFERFRVEASPVIEKPLESKGFETRTYKGVGIDDPSATIRFEEAFDGFHAMVRSSKGVFYIDPSTKDSQRGAQGTYLSYFASARRRPARRLHCEVSSERAKRNQASLLQKKQGSRTTAESLAPEPAGLRTYNLAVAVNSYYVAAVYDGSLTVSAFDQAAAAVTRTVNRINGIYESELGIRLNLVPDEAKLIYTDPRRDPYRGVNADAQGSLAANQANLDKVIGKDHYDIGHLFTTQTAGLASVGSVCNADYKGQGVTGIDAPTGDDFDVDYVSHEIGHQFGANHTFNAISKSCKGNRYAETAYEPGSGSTIMAYAGKGICDPESLQDHSDAYFHLASLLEIEGFINDSNPGGGASCGTSAPLSFGRPSISAEGSYIVPKGTPFMLTAVLKKDPSNPTMINWEEFDLGDTAPPDDESGSPSVPRPLFRSRPPENEGFRFFPDFESLIHTSGSPTLGEALPMLDRTMKFRVTGRNNHGSFSYAETPVKIDVSSGPFKIVSVSGGISWSHGSIHKIQWDVANTGRDPVRCAKVSILLAIDEDPSKLYPLAEGILNSGSYNLTVPADVPVTDRGFLIVKADQNIFLAVYSSPLQITAH